jgi:hypothetical protein
MPTSSNSTDRSDQVGVVALADAGSRATAVKRGTIRVIAVQRSSMRQYLGRAWEHEDQAVTIPTSQRT